MGDDEQLCLVAELVDEVEETVEVDVVEGRIQTVRIVRNPDKLRPWTAS